MSHKSFLQSHSCFITWREKLRSNWFEVIIKPYHLDGMKESNWICDNLEGYFAFRSFYDTVPKEVDSGIIFVFELEEDAMAFKLRWS